jgi:hypothetical protein
LDVRHDDVGRLLVQELTKAPAHVEVFAAADRRLGAVPDIGHGIDIFRRNRFFKP